MLQTSTEQGLTFQELRNSLVEVDPGAPVTTVLVQQPEVVLLHQVQAVAHLGQ
jgi:hypothetical protein